MRSSICDTEPTTSYMPRNVYQMHVPLFVLDVIRLFQDHPKFKRGLKEQHIIDMMQKESFACGDVSSQVKMALKELQACGFVRYYHQGYRTLGPFSKLALARTPRQLNIAWERLCESHTTNSTNVLTGVGLRRNNGKK